MRITKFSKNSSAGSKNLRARRLATGLTVLALSAGVVAPLATIAPAHAIGNPNVYVYDIPIAGPVYSQGALYAIVSNTTEGELLWCIQSGTVQPGPDEVLNRQNIPSNPENVKAPADLVVNPTQMAYILGKIGKTPDQLTEGAVSYVVHANFEQAIAPNGTPEARDKAVKVAEENINKSVENKNLAENGLAEAENVLEESARVLENFNEALEDAKEKLAESNENLNEASRAHEESVSDLVDSRRVFIEADSKVGEISSAKEAITNDLNRVREEKATLDEAKENAVNEVAEAKRSLDSVMSEHSVLDENGVEVEPNTEVSPITTDDSSDYSPAEGDDHVVMIEDGDAVGHEASLENESGEETELPSAVESQPVEVNEADFTETEDHSVVFDEE